MRPFHSFNRKEPHYQHQLCAPLAPSSGKNRTISISDGRLQTSTQQRRHHRHRGYALFTHPGGKSRTAPLRVASALYLLHRLAFSQWHSGIISIPFHARRGKSRIISISVTACAYRQAARAASSASVVDLLHASRQQQQHHQHHWCTLSLRINFSQRRERHHQHQRHTLSIPLSGKNRIISISGKPCAYFSTPRAASSASAADPSHANKCQEPYG